MKRCRTGRLCVLPLFLMAFFCTSCVVKPGYRPELHSPLFAGRTGRPFESSRHLPYVAGTSARALADGFLGLDAERIVGAPAFLAVNALLCPLWDVISLPRDLYIRNWEGANVMVVLPDGTPVPDADVLVCEKSGNQVREVGSYKTDSDGVVYVPRKASVVKVANVRFPDETKPGTFWMSFVRPSPRLHPINEDGFSLAVVCFQNGVSYAPLTWSVNAEIPLDKNDPVLPWLLDVDLATASVTRPGHKPDARARIDWSGRELRLSFPFHGGDIPFVVTDDDERFDQPGRGSSVFLTEDDKKRSFVIHDMDGTWDVAKKETEDRPIPETRRRHPAFTVLKGRNREADGSAVPKRTSKGLPAGKNILFKVGGHFGLLTEFSVEYGGDLENPVLHMHWLFNPEIDKDWFDMDGVPVQAVGTASRQTAGNLEDLHSVNAPKDRR